MNNNFDNKWVLWFHNKNNDWTIKGFTKAYEINTIADFWKLYNTWENTNQLTNKHYFLMKNDYLPLWEYTENGGCWSFKISENNAYHLWKDLSTYLVCEILCPTIHNEIIGLSICLKKNNYVIIKIWNTNSKNNSLKLLNEKILKQWGIDIIYIAHMIDK
jgi:hypothetical protein